MTGCLGDTFCEWEGDTMTELSPLPKPSANPIRDYAAVLWRSLKARGSLGLSWTESWELLRSHTDADTRPPDVGRVITWLRSQGVEVVSVYEAGETRFRLEDLGEVMSPPPVSPTVGPTPDDVTETDLMSASWMPHV